MNKTIVLKSSGLFNEFEKHEVIKDYLLSGKSKDEIWRKYTGLADHGGLIRWMRDLGYLTSSQQLMPNLASKGFIMPKKKVDPGLPEEQFEQLQLKSRIAECTNPL